ncbi:MAG TPA: hypothetical protein VMR45_00860 [Patescibacteria group bacterium]|nr:hypothetical protein [Patescibacteria group bacterium]
MKTNNKQNHQKPFHLHVEYFFRKRYCLLAVLGLMGFVMMKSDGKVMGIVREAYAQGFGIVGQFMREETTKTPILYESVGRVPTISGK